MTADGGLAAAMLQQGQPASLGRQADQLVQLESRGPLVRQVAMAQRGPQALEQLALPDQAAAQQGQLVLSLADCLAW